MTTTETHFIEKEPNRDEADSRPSSMKFTLDAEQIVRVIRYFENKWDLCGRGRAESLDADAENRIGFRPGQFFKLGVRDRRLSMAFHVREVEQQADMTKLQLKRIAADLDTLPAVNEPRFVCRKAKTTRCRSRVG